MIDPVLERNLADCSALLDRWKQFHEYLATSVKGDGLSPEREAQFLEIKSNIAMLHDSFMKVLQADKNIGQSVLTIVSRAITLHHLARMSVAEVKKMEIEWHQAFLLLQETLGNLEDKRAELANISEAAYRAEQMRLRTKQRIDSILKSNTFIGLAIFVSIFFVTVGVQVLGIFDWASLRNIPATRNAFYIVYDKGVRLVFPRAPYYRLDWVTFTRTPERIGEVFPAGWWVHDPSALTTPDSSSNHSVAAELGRLLPQDITTELNAANDTKQMWAFNSQEYICFGLFLMDSRAQARRVADSIRNALSGTPAGDLIGTATRANILIVIQGVPLRGTFSETARSTLAEFIQRIPDLIK